MLQDVCIYDPVPIKEAHPANLPVATIALRLLPALIREYETRDVPPTASRGGTVLLAFEYAEAFLRVCKERGE